MHLNKRITQKAQRCLEKEILLILIENSWIKLDVRMRKWLLCQELSIKDNQIYHKVPPTFWLLDIALRSFADRLRNRWCSFYFTFSNLKENIPSAFLYRSISSLFSQSLLQSTWTFFNFRWFSWLFCHLVTNLEYSLDFRQKMMTSWNFHWNRVF